jgi:hypothetical protein
MRSIRGFVVLASAAALALPAAAATPSKATQVPRHEIAALRAKVKRLEAANKRLASAARAGAGRRERYPLLLSESTGTGVTAPSRAVSSLPTAR